MKFLSIERITEINLEYMKSLFSFPCCQGHELAFFIWVLCCCNTVKRVINLHLIIKFVYSRCCLFHSKLSVSVALKAIFFLLVGKTDHSRNHNKCVVGAN